MKTLRPNKRALRRAIKQQQRRRHTVKVTPMIVTSAVEDLEAIMKILGPRPETKGLRKRLAAFRKKGWRFKHHPEIKHRRLLREFGHVVPRS